MCLDTPQNTLRLQGCDSESQRFLAQCDFCDCDTAILLRFLREKLATSKLWLPIASDLWLRLRGSLRAYELPKKRLHRETPITPGYLRKSLLRPQSPRNHTKPRKPGVAPKHPGIPAEFIWSAIQNPTELHWIHLKFPKFSHEFAQIPPIPTQKKRGGSYPTYGWSFFAYSWASFLAVRSQVLIRRTSPL